MIYIVTTAVGYSDLDSAPFKQSLLRTNQKADPLTYLITECEGEPNNARLPIALSVVKELEQDANIVLTDFRDVVFQKDLTDFPFDRPGIFFESGCYNEEPYNQHWLSRDYGLDFLQSVWNMPITCCGVVTGKKDFILDYLEFCCSELEHLPNIEHGADTSVHARYVWKNNLTYYKDNERSPVYTVGLKNSVRVGHGFIYNDCGDRPFIVHQYDRHMRSLV